MTLVCFKNDVIAADTALTDGSTGMIVSKNYHKIQKLIMVSKEPNWVDSKEVLAAFTGPVAEFVAMKVWWMNGCHQEDWPFNDKMNTGFIILTKERYYYWSPATWSNPEVINYNNIKYQAWGFGTDFARGAMELGKSAIEAVKLTTENNVYLGGNVLAFNINTLKQIK